MREFQVPSRLHKRQTVFVSDAVVSLLEKPGGLVLEQWKIEELMDIAFMPAERTVGSKKVEFPHGHIRLARNWHERRLGRYEDLFRNQGSKWHGITFDIRGEEVAFELFNFLQQHPGVVLAKAPHLAQIESDRFVLTLMNNELIITHRLAHSSLNQVFLSSTPLAGETSIPLNEIDGFSFREAFGDKTRLGDYVGELQIESSRSRARSERANMLSVHFPRKLNDQIRDFITVVEDTKAELVTLGTNIEARPSESLARQISDLAGLLASGLLSDEEFQAAKTKLLSD